MRGGGEKPSSNSQINLKMTASLCDINEERTGLFIMGMHLIRIAFCSLPRPWNENTKCRFEKALIYY